MNNTIQILFILLAILALNSCNIDCPECKECNLTIHYEWKISNQGLDIINIDNDRLIASEVFYKSNPDGYGNIQFVKDSGNYLIDKSSGKIIDTIFGFVPKSAENKILHFLGHSEKSGFFFPITNFQFTIAENYKGYKIVLHEFYKNIRHSNNTMNNVIIYKNQSKLIEKCLPRIFDFTYDQNSVYIFSDTEIYKFNFDEFIKLVE